MAQALDVDGVDQLHDSLVDAAARLREFPTASQRAGALLEAEAVQAAPRRTGRLAASHRHTVAADLVTVTATARYAVYVHARRPWLAETLHAQAAKVAALYAEELDDITHSIRGA